MDLDNESMCINIDDRLINACIDYRYLLSRDYNMKSALDLVSSRYILNRVERSLLLRCIHRPDYVRELEKKKISEDSVRGGFVIIDLFNVLSTLATLLSGDCVYLCDDGFLRDIRGSRHTFKREVIYRSIEIMASALSDLSVSEAVYVIDKNISKSAELATEINNRTLTRGLVSSFILAEKADRMIIDLSARRESIVISSDAVVLERVSRTFDLVGYIANRNKYIITPRERIIDLSGVLKL
ncbi:MAG: DUF434 domain-containing protein [Sulfolobales archaeon]